MHIKVQNQLTFKRAQDMVYINTIVDLTNIAFKDKKKGKNVNNVEEHEFFILI